MGENRDHPGAEQRETVTIYQAARFLNFRFVKQHQLSLANVGLLSDPFPFITEEVISKLVAEKDESHLAASGVDTDYDLWEFWRDSKTRLPHWYEVAKDIALIQSSSVFFMEQVFSILRACMDERQESSFSDRIAASALLKYSTTEGGENRSTPCWGNGETVSRGLFCFLFSTFDFLPRV